MSVLGILIGLLVAVIVWYVLVAIHVPTLIAGLCALVVFFGLAVGGLGNRIRY